MMNLYAVPTEVSETAEEWLESILTQPGVRIERIISTGQISPPGFYYDQSEQEWVTLLQGEARLQFDDREVVLEAGDAVLIAAHERHRVAYTSHEPPCIWLCVFFEGGTADAGR